MDDTLRTEEQLLRLMRSLSIRIKKAERERDCAVRQLKQLKSILDGFSPDSPGKDPLRSVSPRLKKGAPVVDKTSRVTTDAFLRHEASENRACDSGLASLTNGLEHSRDANEEKSGRSSMTSEHGDSGSLQMINEEDRIVRAPLKMISHKAPNLNLRSPGNPCSQIPCSILQNFASKPSPVTKSSLLDGQSDSNTDGFLYGNAKAGDTCTRVGSLESRIEPPILRDSFAQSSSTCFKNALPLTRSFLRTLAAPSNNFGSTDEESPKFFTAHQEYKGTDLFGRKLSSSDESCLQDQKERSHLGDTEFPTFGESLQPHLTHPPRSQTSNLKRFPSDPPISQESGFVNSTPFSGSDMYRFRSTDQNTVPRLKRQHHTGACQSQPVKQESPMKFNKQTSTRTTSGVMSRSWLRKLICRLEELSDNYHSHSPDHLPVVRFDCDTELPIRARTRSSSCSPSRSQIFDNGNLTVRRNSSPTSSLTTPLSSQISRSSRPRFITKRSPSSSGMYSHSGYPLFVPVDQVPRNLGKRTKPSIVGRANIYAKPGTLRMGSVTKDPTRRPSILRRSPSRVPKSNPQTVEMRSTPRSRSQSEVRQIPSPRIRIFNPDGTSQDCDSESFPIIRIHRVHDVSRQKVGSRLSWN